MLFDTITKELDTIFQKEIEIVLKNKVIRKGTLILYQTQDYYITLFLKTATTTKKYDIPYPFNVNINDNQLVFSYDLSHVMMPNDNFKTIQKYIVNTTTNRLLNECLVINY